MRNIGIYRALTRRIAPVISAYDASPYAAAVSAGTFISNNAKQAETNVFLTVE
ncbi:MAG TPA: hypothetical protein VF980_12195 [Thermoanaerobaculia bacterium]